MAIDEFFKKEKALAAFLEPGTGNYKEQEIEYREDKILGINARINVARASRPKQVAGAPPSKPKVDFCSFCSENIEKSTPKFPPDLIKEGRMQRGEAVLFPNLFPFAKYHAVVTVSSQHLSIEEFTEEQIENAVSLSVDFFRKVNSKDEKARYPSLNWNNLPTAAASIIHPHLQLVVDEKPSAMVNFLMKASLDYYEKTGENYWKKLVALEEKARERFIGRTGSISWLASFSPLGNNEVLAVFNDAFSLDISEGEVKDFSKGIKKILNAYHALGISSYNLTTYSGSVEKNEEAHYCLTARMISRPSLREFYTSDAGFMELLHRERVVENLPEELAKHAKKYF